MDEPVDEPVDDSVTPSFDPATIDLVFEEAFEDLYLRAYGVAYQLLGRRSEAEDVAQETLARAFVRWRKVRSYAEAWVVRLAGTSPSTPGGRRRVDTDADTRRRTERPFHQPARRPPPPSTALAPPAGHRAALPRRPAQADVKRGAGCSLVSETHASRALAALHHDARRGAAISGSAGDRWDASQLATRRPVPGERGAAAAHAHQMGAGAGSCKAQVRSA